jgi:AcrR family transcriptional regulator
VRAPGQIPRGRHGLSPEAVRASQHERMVRAMAAVVAERGYVRATVADVIRGAGVSRETFYQHFEDKEGAFLGTLDACAQTLRDRLADAAGPDGPPIARLERALGAYLGAMREEPVLARVCLIEAYAAGPAALRRRTEMLDGFVALVSGVFGARTTAARFSCEAWVGAVSSMVTMRVATGETDDLPALHAPLLGLAAEILGAGADTLNSPGIPPGERRGTRR